jgi:hypothetical protein
MAYNRTYFGNFTSDQDIEYRIEFHDQVASSSYYDQPLVLGPGSVSIKWGSDGNKMFAPLKPSTMTIEFMVTDILSANYIKQLRTAREERDVYVYLYNPPPFNTSVTAMPQWGGYLLMDLSADPDESVPYVVTLNAIDGLASLKYYDFIPDTSTQSSDHLYIGSDVFFGKSNFSKIIASCMYWAGVYTMSTGSQATARRRHAVRWYNAEHANTTVDPLEMTRMQDRTWYDVQQPDENGTVKYKAPSCYKVLTDVCKAWGMRAFYWHNTWYFVQINEFRENQVGTYIAPDDITSFVYYMNNSPQTGISNTIQPNPTVPLTGPGPVTNLYAPYTGTYHLPLDNRPNNSIVNYKLTGGQYSNLPALKQVDIEFNSLDNFNYFTRFPDIPGYGDATAATDHYTFESLGTFEFDGTNDQFFYQRIILNISNNSNASGDLEFFWTLVARPAGTGSDTLDTSPQSNGWTRQLYNLPVGSPVSGPTQWMGTGISGFTNAWIQQSSFGAADNTLYGMWNSVAITPGMTTVELTSAPSAGGSTSSNYRYVNFLQAGASEWDGEWELAYYCRNYRYSSTHIGPHGAANLGANPSSNDPEAQNINYLNAAPNQGEDSSCFVQINNGAVGNYAYNTSTVLATNDTAVERVTAVVCGDAGGSASGGGLQVFTGATFTGAGEWKWTDIAGEWGIDTLAGSNTFTAQLAADILNAQSGGPKIFSVTTTNDPTESLYLTDASGSQTMTPAPFTRFFTPSDGQTATTSHQWIMHTGVWSPFTDTWQWKLYEQKNYNVAGTTTTVGTAGSYTGIYGNAGIPIPTGGSAALIAPPPAGNPPATLSKQIMSLNTHQPTQVAIVNGAQIIDLDAASGTVISQTVTSISVQYMTKAIFKTGDVFSLQTQANSYLPYNQDGTANTNDLQINAPLEFEVASDQGVGDTSIRVVSQTIYRDILIGDTISFSVDDLVSQYQNKTKGSIGDMAVTSDSLDGAKSLGRNVVNFRVEGDNLTDATYYVLNGEDNNKSGRFGSTNANAPTSIGTQRAVKSMKFIADCDYEIVSGRSVITGDSGWSMDVLLYKTTPVQGSTSASAMTLIGTYTVGLTGNATTQVDTMAAGTSSSISAGDIIVPHIYAAESGGSTFDFRGGITFTLKRV